MSLVPVRGIDNSIHYPRAILVGGFAVGWGYIDPSSALGFLSAVVVGAAGGVIATLTYSIADDAYDKWRHRILPHQPFNEKTAEEALKSAFKKIQCHPEYEGFKKIVIEKNSGIQSLCLIELGSFGKIKVVDEAIYSFIKKDSRIQSNICMGFAAALLQTLDREPHSTIDQVLEKINQETVFYFQFLEVMRGVYALWRSGKSRDLSIEKLKNELISWEEWESEQFSVKEPAVVVQYHLQKLLNKTDQAVSGWLLIEGDEIDRENRRFGHAITFQCVGGKFLFYDTIDSSNGLFSHGGLYEYKDLLEFCEALKRRATEDMGYQYHQILLKFYIKK